MNDHITTEASAAASAAFLQACELDVAVRKPGNVSDHSAGHGMQAAMFRASARAAAVPLFTPGLRVGARIEAAVAATRAVAGCNTNLGILLLCAPLARACEEGPMPASAVQLQQRVEAVLSSLDLSDTQAAYRAIAHANPGGLGRSDAQDVHAAPTIGLRAAMALAAERDSVARQYRDAYADLFGTGLAALAASGPCAQGQARDHAAVQRLYLQLLSSWPDSHIVRKQGAAVAHSVMRVAQGWLNLLQQEQQPLRCLDLDPAFLAWDEQLKETGINPGTTADLTVTALFIDALLRHAVMAP